MERVVSFFFLTIFALVWPLSFIFDCFYIVLLVGFARLSQEDASGIVAAADVLSIER